MEKKRARSSKKDSNTSPSGYHKELPKVESDQSIFNKFYTEIKRKEDETKETSKKLKKITYQFNIWYQQDKQKQLKCCLNKELVEKCENCFLFLNGQKKLIIHSIKEIYYLFDDILDALSSIRQTNITENTKNDILSDKLINCDLSLFEYMERLVEYLQIWHNKNTFGIHSNIGLYCLFFSYKYILKLSKIICVTQNNIYSLISITMLLAYKYLADKPMNMKWWSEVIDIEFSLVKNLEIEIYSILDFQLEVPLTEVIDMYHQCIPNIDSIVPYEHEVV